MAYVSWETKRQAAKIADAKAKANQTTADAAMLGAQAEMAKALTSMHSDMPNIDLPQPFDVGGGGGATESPPLMSTGSSSSIGAPLEGTIGSAPSGQVGITYGMQSPAIGSAFDTLANPKKFQLYAQGGPVRGPQGRDQVPAIMPDGSPARLNEGEYVQPREEVVAYAVQMLGKRSEGLTEDQLNEIGLKLLSRRTEEVTGRAPGPEMVRPLAGQGRAAVPGMVGGSGDELAASRLQGLKTLQEIERKKRETLYNSQPLETPNGVPLTRSGSQQTRMLNEQGMNNTLALTPGAFRDAKTLYQAEQGPVDTRKAGIPQVPSNVTGLVRNGVGGPSFLTMAQLLSETVRGEQVRDNPDAPLLSSPAPESVLSPGPRIKNASQTSSQPPQADPRARAIAQYMTTQRPQTEQELLNQITPQGASLTREGRVFRYEDPVAMRPGRAAPAEPRVIRGRGGVPIPQNNFPVINGWEAPDGRRSLAMAAKRDRTYDHLPISGVTYSDSIGGTSLGQIRPPKADPQVLDALNQRYEQDAIGRAAERQVMGLDPRPELVNRPAVSEAQAGNLAAIRRGLDLARIQAQAQKPADQAKATKEARDTEKHLRWRQENFVKDAEPAMQQAAARFPWMNDGGASYFQRASTLGQDPQQVLKILAGAQQALAQSDKPLFTVSGQAVTGIDAIRILNGERPLDPWFWFGPGDEFYDEARRMAAEAVQSAALQELAQ